MIAIYIVAAILGGGLVIASVLFGHGEHASGDSGHDAQIDVHGHADGGEAHVWIPFLSLRFWTYLVAVFGVAGLLLSKFTTLIEPMPAILSGGTGLVVGLLVSFLMRVAKKLEVDSSTKTQDFLGAVGRVVVAIRPGQEGKIRLSIKGDTIEVLALPNEFETLEIGSEAIIVSMENDRARVISRSELLEETQINA